MKVNFDVCFLMSKPQHFFKRLEDTIRSEGLEFHCKLLNLAPKIWNLVSLDLRIVKCLFISFIVVMFNLLDADLAAGVKFSSFLFHLCIVYFVVNTHVDQCFIMGNNVNNMSFSLLFIE